MNKPSSLSSVLILCLVLQGTGAANIQYEIGDPTGEEQQMLEMINRARHNPAAEGQRFLDTTDQDVVNAINYFTNNFSMDIEAVAAEFATYAPRPPMAFNAALMDVAYEHSQYMISENRQTHDRVDSSTNANAFRDSFTNAGYSEFSWIGENVFSRSLSPWYGHAALNIDWGAGGNAVNGIQTPPGHRRTIMGLLRYPNDPYVYPDYREVGIAVIPENDSGTTNVGPLVISQDFGRVNGETFLTGVVYNDTNADGFYSTGEGIGGVTIMPSLGDYYAVTSNSGGYAIPFYGYSGAVTLSISGGGLPAHDVTVMMEGENVKVDVIDGEVVNDSHWRQTPAFGDYYKNSSVGMIRDITWPWIFHFGEGNWIHFRYAKRIDTSLEGQLIHIPGNPARWGWTRDDMGPWYYDFNAAAWRRL